VASFVYDKSTMSVMCIGDLNELLYDIHKSSPNVNQYFQWLNNVASFIWVLVDRLILGLTSVSPRIQLMKGLILA
jgi:mannitol-1-phosphate/altronate dehydrogenase